MHMHNLYYKVAKHFQIVLIKVAERHSSKLY